MGYVLYYSILELPLKCIEVPKLMPTATQKTTIVTKPPAQRDWVLFDAGGQVLGRLAVKIATILMGKHKPTYTAHVDTGDFVVVINCRQLKVSGKKLEQTTHDTYSGYPGGLRQTPREKIFEQRPEFLLTLAVKRMLPKSPLGRHMLSKLKAYADSDHPHQAQQPKPLEV